MFQKKVLIIQNCLNNWGGGKLSSGTIEKYTRYLQQLMTVTKVNNFFDLVLVPENRNSISDHLGLVAESSPSICTSTLAALSSLQRYLSCNKMTDICDRSLEPELKAFENQLVLWNRSNNSNKKADNARLRVSINAGQGARSPSFLFDIKLCLLLWQYSKNIFQLVNVIRFANPLYGRYD